MPGGLNKQTKQNVVVIIGSAGAGAAAPRKTPSHDYWWEASVPC